MGTIFVLQVNNLHAGQKKNSKPSARESFGLKAIFDVTPYQLGVKCKVNGS